MDIDHKVLCDTDDDDDGDVVISETIFAPHLTIIVQSFDIKFW